MALLHAIKALEGVKPANDDQRVGVEIVRKAIQWPARQIAENAGLDGAVVVGKLLESNDANWGFDAQANEYGDLVGRGVIDPAKVVRTALQDAASVAGLLITTEAMVAEKPKKESPDAGRRPRWRRHGRHGRHGLLSREWIKVDGKGRGRPRPCHEEGIQGAQLP